MLIGQVGQTFLLGDIRCLICLLLSVPRKVRVLPRIHRAFVARVVGVHVNLRFYVYFIYYV